MAPKGYGVRWALVLTALGGLLRFRNLDRPLWVDEVLFAFWVRDGGYSQEFIPIWFAQAIGADTEVTLRLLSAICGTLTIFAVWHVTKNLWATAFVSVFPLFVFWSQLARPYSVAGLFIVLGWRYSWSYIPALLCTPVSVLGLRIAWSRRYMIGAVLAGGLVLFLIRPDTGRFRCLCWKIIRGCGMSHVFRLSFILLLLWMSKESLSASGWRWYSQEVNFSDWRGVPCVDYSSNAVVTNWYVTCNAKYLRPENALEIRARWDRGDTLTFGMDYYALFLRKGDTLIVPGVGGIVPTPEMLHGLFNGKVFVIQTHK